MQLKDKVAFITGAGSGIGKAAALLFAKHKIHVNVVCSGAIDTEIENNSRKRDVAKAKEPVESPAGKIPLTDGKLGTADEVARLVLFASDCASHISGTPVWIDGAEFLLQG